MIRTILGLAVLAALPAALSAQTAPPMTLEQQMMLRCSAAFAMVAQGQDNGNEAAKAWPDIKRRGQEYFVRSMARLMDELQLDRQGVAALIGSEAQQLWDTGQIEAIMPACLSALEAQGIR